MLSSWEKSYDKPRQWIKRQRHHFADKDPSSQIYGFSSSHVLMWELDQKEGWASKNLYFQIIMMEKTPECCLDSKEIKSGNPKGNQPWTLGVLMLKLKLQYWWEETTHWKRPWCLERLKAGGEGDDRGWEIWMASTTQ